MKPQKKRRMWNLCVRKFVIYRHHSNHKTVESSPLQSLPSGYGKLSNRKIMREPHRRLNLNNHCRHWLTQASTFFLTTLDLCAWSLWMNNSYLLLLDFQVCITALECVYGWPVIPTGCNRWHLLIDPILFLWGSGRFSQEILNKEWSRFIAFLNKLSSTVLVLWIGRVWTN